MVQLVMNKNNSKNNNICLKPIFTAFFHAGISRIITFSVSRRAVFLQIGNWMNCKQAT